MYSRLCRQVLSRSLQQPPTRQVVRSVSTGKPATAATASLTPVDRIWKDFEDRLHRFTEGVRSQFDKFNVSGAPVSESGLQDTSSIWPFEPDRLLFAVPQILNSADGSKVYKLEIPIGKNFMPDNVKVVLKLQDFTLTINAVNDEMSSDGLQRMHREVKRQIMLPDYVDLNKVSTSLGEDGVLCLEAPVLPDMEPPTLVKEIPITYLEA